MTFWRLLSFIGLFALIQSVYAEHYFYWDFINVDIELQKNTDLLITETQKYVFTRAHSNQRYRWIPLDNVDEITDVAVFEGDKKLAFDTSRKNNQLWIRWQHTLKDPPESHTFVLKYRVVGGVKLGIRHASMGRVDQIHWKAIFKNRPASIKNSRIVVHLPIPNILSNKMFSYQIITQNILKVSTRSINDQTLEFVPQRKIFSAEGLEIKVNFLSGFLEKKNYFYFLG